LDQIERGRSIVPIRNQRASMYRKKKNLKEEDVEGVYKDRSMCNEVESPMGNGRNIMDVCNVLCGVRDKTKD
jgi:hypothetical protein